MKKKVVKPKQAKTKTGLRPVQRVVRRKISLFDEIMQEITSYRDRVKTDKHFENKYEIFGAMRALNEMIGNFKAIKSLRKYE